MKAEHRGIGAHRRVDYGFRQFEPPTPAGIVVVVGAIVLIVAFLCGWPTR